MNGDWHSYTPDGRTVVMRRRGEFWFVRCGTSRGRSTNLYVALNQAIRAEAPVIAHAHRVDYPTWIRCVADTVDSEV